MAEHISVSPPAGDLLCIGATLGEYFLDPFR
jgi:hypothetical protein